MTRRYILLAAAMVLVSCGSPTDGEKPANAASGPAAAPPAESPPAPAPAAAAPVPGDSSVASSGGTTLRYFSDILETDRPQKPSFELQAERLAMMEDQDNVWIVEKAHATAYGKDGSEIHFEADSGRFNDNTKITTLDGNVVCTMGSQRVEMQDVTWTNETRTASTAKPVVVSDGNTKLQARRMEYRTETRTLLLHDLSGTVSTQPPAAGGDSATPAAGPGPFRFIDVNKGGLGTFVDGQMKDISGGVAIGLRPTDPNEKPMQLSAEKMTFAWDESERTKPMAIELEGGVSVDGPQGLISAKRADLNLASNSLVFAGDVHGKSGSIDSFDAERIAYDMKTGDSQMTGLVARGIAMGAEAGDAQAGAADFSQMDIEHAGSVISNGGQVKEMSGGVAIALKPGGAGPPMKLNAGSASFAWSGDGGRPMAIAMRGSVRVDGPQGAILSDRADFNLGKKELQFTGKVNGSLPQLERFECDTLAYNLSTGETLMTNLTAKGLTIATDTEKGGKAADKGAKDQTYSQMDIESAPEVSLTGQRINWMRGGVSLTMHSADPDGSTMAVTAQELTFTYGKESPTPQRVAMKGGVAVKSPAMDIQSDKGELDMQANRLVLDGNVKASSPEWQDVTATRITYDLTTGARTITGGEASRIRVKTPDQPKQP